MIPSRSAPRSRLARSPRAGRLREPARRRHARIRAFASLLTVAAVALSACERGSDPVAARAAAERPAAADPADWCAEHAVPESMCTLCHPELRQRYVDAGDFCRPHGLPESVCPLCNPLEPPEGAPKHPNAGAGHGFDSKAAPKAAPEEVPQRPAAADPADWCAEHAVPESMCTLCHPELRQLYVDAGDFCRPHGLPESVCPLCNPLEPPEGAPKHPNAGAGHGFDSKAAPKAAPEEVPQRPAAADPADWCAEHAVPESMCTLCHPELRQLYVDAGDFCRPHGLPESVCPLCNPLEPPEGAPKHPNAGAGHGSSAPAGGASEAGLVDGLQVRLRSEQLERIVGVETAAVLTRALSDTLTVPVRVDFDRDRLAEVRPAVPGLVREVRVRWGEEVEEGAVLFVLESADVGALQAREGGARARLRAARATLARRTELRGDGIASESALEEARRELAEARAELVGVESSLALTGAEAAEAAGRFAVTAPRAGTVVQRPAVVGAFADASELLAVIADRTAKWARLEVAARDAGAIRLGQPVELRIEGAPTQVFAGRVAWISPEVEPRTRTVEVRATVPDPDGLLLANQFAAASIRLTGAEAALAVPIEAVQRFGAGAVVFVRVGPGVYEPRQVTPGRADRGIVAVRGDLKSSEEVVTTGAYLLRTELDRGAIGAGCCESD